MRNNMSLYFALSSFVWFASCMNPMARFTMSAQHAEAPAMVNFQNTSEGAICMHGILEMVHNLLKWQQTTGIPMPENMM